MVASRKLQATELEEQLVIRLTRRGRIVGWVSVAILAGVVGWGLLFPERAPEFFSWPPAQLVIMISAIQTIIQLAIDQRKGLIRVGPENTTVWRVGGLPKRYESSRVALTAEGEKGHLLVDDRPVSRLDLFDIQSAVGR